MRPAPVLSLILVVSLFCFGHATEPQTTETSTASDLTALIEKVRPSIVTIRVNGRDGDHLQMGTGFIIESTGLIVSNFHVIGEGRPFTLETATGRKLDAVSVESSDRASDLVIIRVDVTGEPLPALAIAEGDVPPQGTRVLAFGNPLGLENSVVSGIVSAVREVDGNEMIQLAMPVEPGNSGGPLVDGDGRVVGVVNMKSAIDDNLGFAIPINRLAGLRAQPNPVEIDRWVRLGEIDSSKWTTLMGATWQDRGGLLSARGVGKNFGGRSICLFHQEMPQELPFEVTVQVRLDDEAGAAGLAFCADGQDKHYGFYPTAGRLRLTCFQGPTVYAWQVLEDVECEHYLPNQWNRIRVRMEEGRILCFVNEQLLIESTDRQLTSGKFGLVKFRDTNPDFKGFRFGPDVSTPKATAAAQDVLNRIIGGPLPSVAIDAEELSLLGEASEDVGRRLAIQAKLLEAQAEKLRRLAAEMELAPTIRQLVEREQQLLRGALLIAKLDTPDLDVDAYVDRVEQMAKEILTGIEDETDQVVRRNRLHEYLFLQTGFRGGTAEYYHSANSHLHRVIDDREGLPITLSILYMELASRLDLNMAGVGLPGHFVVKHLLEDSEQLIDVFDRGKLLSREDAEGIVAGFGRREIVADDLRSQTTVEILSRVLNNLIGVAAQKQDSEAVNRYYEALVALNPTQADARMMRMQIRAATERISGAIEDIDWLLENEPPGFDSVRAQTLRQALLEQQAKAESK
jgi:serine protease Do